MIINYWIDIQDAGRGIEKRQQTNVVDLRFSGKAVEITYIEGGLIERFMIPTEQMIFINRSDEDE